MTGPSHTGTPPRPCAGATLVEVMVAALLLGLIAVTGAAYFYHARAGISLQENRRVMTQVAASRLEEIRLALYEEVAPPAENFSVYYLSRPGGAWIHATADPEEVVTLHGLPMRLTTTVQYLDLDPGAADSFDYIKATVRASYRKDTTGGIQLETCVAPWL